MQYNFLLNIAQLILYSKTVFENLDLSTIFDSLQANQSISQFLFLPIRSSRSRSEANRN